MLAVIGQHPGRLERSVGNIVCRAATSEAMARVLISVIRLRRWPGCVALRCASLPLKEKLRTINQGPEHSVP
jgi:hypothetical protein